MRGDRDILNSAFISFYDEVEVEAKKEEYEDEDYEKQAEESVKRTLREIVGESWIQYPTKELLYSTTKAGKNIKKDPLYFLLLGHSYSPYHQYDMKTNRFVYQEELTNQTQRALDIETLAEVLLMIRDKKNSR